MSSLLRRWRNGNKTPRSSPTTNAGYFGLLPPELTQLIATSLPPSSAASLALTCHNLLHVIGTQYFLCLEPDSQESDSQGSETVQDRGIFLTGLVRDLPAGSSFYCHDCHKVHLLPLKKRRVVCLETKCVPELWTPTHERIFERVAKSLCRWGGSSYINDHDGTANTRTVYHKDFSFEHVQMAIQLHQRGSFHTLKGYLSFLSLKNEQIIDISTSKGPKGYRFYFFEPRIVNSQMIVRAQTCIVMPHNERLHVHKLSGLPEFGSDTTVCAHSGAGGLGESRLRRAINCASGHSRCRIISPCCLDRVCVMRCPNCPTELKVRAETFYVDKVKTRRVVVLFVTKWQWVGDGTSPYDGRWANPLNKNCDRWDWPKDSAFSIKDTYEHQPGTKFDSILDAKKAWKLVKRYQNDFEGGRTV